MAKTITIPMETYKCLRGHLEEAAKIFNSLGIPGRILFEETKTPTRAPKETKTQKVNKYKNLIGSGQRGLKPEYLKK